MDKAREDRDAARASARASGRPALRAGPRAAARVPGPDGAKRQRGATLVEFLAVAPIVLGIGGGTLQTGLLYHGKTTLNYATFEAARAGATHHARVAPMLDELGLRLAPLEGGTGELASAAAAIVKSKLAVRGPYTRIRVLNPTAEAFALWGETSVESGRRVIPNSHLRHRDDGTRAQVSLQDANLLKIEVVHGVELKVPLVGGLLAAAMTRIDPENAAFYRDNRFPLTSVATVRMQSEAWGNDILLAAAAPAGGGGETVTDASSPVAGGATTPHDAMAGGTTGGGAGGGGGLCDGSPPLDAFLPTLSSGQDCGVVSGGGAFAPPPSSPPTALVEGC